MLNTKDIQTKLLQQIEAKIQPRSLVDDLQTVLCLSRSATYRRVKLEAPLSTDEILRLLTHYNISFDGLYHPQATSFMLPSQQAQPKNMLDYLSQIEKDITALSQNPHVKIRYAGLEVPFFHYLLIPEVTFFKLFMWSKTVWETTERQKQQFSIKAFYNNKPLLTQIKRISDKYNEVNSDEIWNINMLDATFNQIRYCLRAGIFQEKADVAKLCEGIRNMLDTLRMRMEAGYKNMKQEKGIFRVWYNEIFPNNTLILADVTPNKYVYFTYDTPNFMLTDNPITYDCGFAFFNGIKSFSSYLSSKNDESRHLYFDRLSRKIAYYESELAIEAKDDRWGSAARGDW